MTVSVKVFLFYFILSTSLWPFILCYVTFDKGYHATVAILATDLENKQIQGEF